MAYTHQYQTVTIIKPLTQRVEAIERGGGEGRGAGFLFKFLFRGRTYVRTGSFFCLFVVVVGDVNPQIDGSIDRIESEVV